MITVGKSKELRELENLLRKRLNRDWRTRSVGQRCLQKIRGDRGGEPDIYYTRLARGTSRRILFLPNLNPLSQRLDRKARRVKTLVKGGPTKADGGPF